ncbi:MAG: hypothetical protein IKS41_04865 [Alphaproteobacteria bacterium]|nr:hypothetical protein [Alphaproteobacteria bacterium]
MKNIYTYLTLAGIVAMAPMVAEAYPAWGFGEVLTQMVDNVQSNAVSDIYQTHQNLMKSVLKGTKGSYSSGSVKKKLKKALTSSSEAITGQYEGLDNVLGKNSSYGQIKVKKCGDNIPSVASRVKSALTLPAKESDRNSLTTAEKNKRDANRNRSIEDSGVTTLAKAWIVETESSNISKAVGSTQKELDGAKSQMMVMVTILRLQEETQKNINTRLSLMGDELITTGLTALDSGL